MCVSRRVRWGMSLAVTLVWLACFHGHAMSAAPQRLGQLPVGMSPDSIDLTASELYVLERGTVSVFSLPEMTRIRTFGGSGIGPGRLSPNHSFDQVIRVVGDTVLVEDNNKLIRFSRAGQMIEEKRKPENSVWFVPIGDRYAAKSMVVEGTPPTQIIRIALYDAHLSEVKELYRQPWFQQRQGQGFSTVLLGDQLHFTVVRDRVCVEESPKGFVVECFDSSGKRVSTIERAHAGVPVTAADRDREMALVRTEKRVALMIGMTGSWEKLRQIWTITFPAVTPPLRELQASANRLLARTFERMGDTVKYVLLDLDGTSDRELWLPMPTDAETEARVSGTAFFKLVGDRYYYLRHDAGSNRWEVYATSLPDDRPKGR
jgi:hypothetical protein